MRTFILSISLRKRYGIWAKSDHTEVTVFNNLLLQIVPTTKLKLTLFGMPFYKNWYAFLKIKVFAPSFPKISIVSLSTDYNFMLNVAQTLEFCPDYDDP